LSDSFRLVSFLGPTPDFTNVCCKRPDRSAARQPRRGGCGQDLVGSDVAHAAGMGRDGKTAYGRAGRRARSSFRQSRPTGSAAPSATGWSARISDRGRPERRGDVEEARIVRDRRHWRRQAPGRIAQIVAVRSRAAVSPTISARGAFRRGPPRTQTARPSAIRRRESAGIGTTRPAFRRSDRTRASAKSADYHYSAPLFAPSLHLLAGHYKLR